LSSAIKNRNKINEKRSEEEVNFFFGLFSLDESAANRNASNFFGRDVVNLVPAEVASLEGLRILHMALDWSVSDCVNQVDLLITISTNEARFVCDWLTFSIARVQGVSVEGRVVRVKRNSKQAVEDFLAGNGADFIVQ
jgi:hypothetical protein